MSWTVVVDEETLGIGLQYPTNNPPIVDMVPGIKLTCEDPSVVMAVRDSEGNVTLQEDPVKLAAKAESQKAANKAKRNQLLQSSDWSTLSDVPLSNKDEWVSYRALLRGVNIDSPEPVWPQEPQVVWSQV